MGNPRIALFIFRRDLRIQDNTALNAAIRAGYRILAIFIVTPEQIDPTKNKFFSHAAVQFMVTSLLELAEDIGHGRLIIAQGDNAAVIDTLYKNVKFSAIYTNADYTPYATSRDYAINKWCRAHSVEFHAIEGDYVLTDPKKMLAGRPADRPYQVFSAYFEKFLKLSPVVSVDNTKIIPIKHFIKTTAANLAGIRIMTPGALQRLYTAIPAPDQQGGRTAGLAILGKMSTFRKYGSIRDTPGNTHGTTHLSAHIKFGTVSIREVYWRARKVFRSRDHPLIRELVFRDFYVKAYITNPAYLALSPRAFDHEVDKRVPWRTGKEAEANFAAWCKGETGFPLVDAGIRQMLTTGYMHNRVRMVVASVLTKYLLIDWRRGAQFFAQHLIDYDPISNLAGWGYVSSTGVDAQPWFRAPMNPFVQSKKYDPEARYIKQWVHELADTPASDIHKWYKVHSAITPGATKDNRRRYPSPIIDYKRAAAKAVSIYSPPK